MTKCIMCNIQSSESSCTLSWLLAWVWRHKIPGAREPPLERTLPGGGLGWVSTFLLYPKNRTENISIHFPATDNDQQVTKSSPHGFYHSVNEFVAVYMIEWCRPFNTSSKFVIFASILFFSSGLTNFLLTPNLFKAKRMSENCEWCNMGPKLNGCLQIWKVKQLEKIVNVVKSVW